MEIVSPIISNHKRVKGEVTGISEGWISLFMPLDTKVAGRKPLWEKRKIGKSQIYLV
jgi:hypothetical protein